MIRFNLEVEIVTNWELLDHFLDSEAFYLWPGRDLEGNINVESHCSCLRHRQDLDGRCSALTSHLGLVGFLERYVGSVDLDFDFHDLLLHHLYHWSRYLPWLLCFNREDGLN